jgi:hypothetical protein
MLKTAGGDHAMAQGAGQGACHHENKQHRPCSLAAPGTPAFAPLELRLASRRLRSLPAEALREGGRATSPLFFSGAGYAVFPSLPPQKARGWRAKRRVIAVSARALSDTWRLSARHRGVFTAAPGRAFGVRFVLPPAQSSRRLSGQPLLSSLGQAATARRQPAPGRGP